MAGGVITLGEKRAKGMTMLAVACNRCERRGRLKIERLIAEHGTGVLDLRAICRRRFYYGTRSGKKAVEP